MGPTIPLPLLRGSVAVYKHLYQIGLEAANVVYGENELFGGPVSPLGVFSRQKTPPVSRELICNLTLLQTFPCPI